jgi:hypothetical protein
MSGPTPHRLPKGLSAAVFLLAMSVLLIEIALTRIFSVMTWYHFTYLIIALALMGFGAAGAIDDPVLANMSSSWASLP